MTVAKYQWNNIEDDHFYNTGKSYHIWHQGCQVCDLFPQNLTIFKLFPWVKGFTYCYMTEMIVLKYFILYIKLIIYTDYTDYTKNSQIMWGGNHRLAKCDKNFRVIEMVIFNISLLVFSHCHFGY